MPELLALIALIAPLPPYPHCGIPSCGSNIQIRLTSICLTDKSKKVMLSRTSMTDLGPTQPIVVPRPPLSLSTASLSRMDGSTLGRTSYFLTCSGLGG